jgi:hypothetical protein
MARRQRNFDANDFYDDEDYGGEYYLEEDEEELAMRESKKTLKQDKKNKKKAKGVQEADIDFMIEQIGDGEFTRDQIRGTLENYSNDKDQAKKQLLLKLADRKKLGKNNIKAEIKTKVEIQKAEQEEKKVMLEKEKELNNRYNHNAKHNEEGKVVKVDKAILNRTYPEVSYNIQDTSEDRNMNLVIVGHVDTGKSTLTGHLLYKLGQVSKNQLRKNEKLAETYGKGGFEFAYFMDES